MALDVGSVRIGVAISDPDGILATPKAAISRDGNPQAEISLLCSEYEPLEIYVGHPVSLSGTETRSTIDAVDFAREIAKATAVEVRLIDERLTTVSAATKLRAAGFDAREAKGLIDSASAVEILEIALDFERRNSKPAGEVVVS